MNMKVTRRDLLTVAGGSAIGVMLTPAPWKLVDDLAIWTQNWKWIPRPPKGPETVAATACSLCPAGCAVDARCIGGLPVSLRAAAGGSLCALGLTGHHLPYHPARLTAPVRLTRNDGARSIVPFSADAVVAATVRAMRDAAARDAAVGVLDMRLGRSASWAWRRLLGQLPHGVLVGAPGREGVSLSTLASMTGAPGAIGFDLSVPTTILSFGAPLAEGWGSAGTLDRIINREVRLIQVEPIRSETAQIAGRWIPCRPGTEGLFALGIANVLLAEGLADLERVRAAEDFDAWAALVATMVPGAVAASTSVPEEAIVATARELAAARPALVLAGEQPGGGRYGRAAETAILGLNLLLGALESGAIVERAELPPPVDAEQLAPLDELARLEDGSLALLLIDASAGDARFPWPLAQRKLAPGALVVALSPFLAGTAAHADLIVPTPPFLESLQELPTPFNAPAASFALSTALLPLHQGMTDPATFIRSLADGAGVSIPGDWKTTEELARLRVGKIHAAGRGAVADRAGATTPVASFASIDELFDALSAGARWVDVPSPALVPSRIALLGDAAGEGGLRAPGLEESLTLLPLLARDVAQTAAVSPLLTKLYRESGLRRPAATAVLNPATAKRLGLRNDSAATLETAEGATRVAVVTDESVMPGIVAAVVGPEPEAIGDPRARASIIDFCPTDSNGVWRSSSARLVEG